MRRRSFRNIHLRQKLGISKFVCNNQRNIFKAFAEKLQKALQKNFPQKKNQIESKSISKI